MKKVCILIQTWRTTWRPRVVCRECWWVTDWDGRGGNPQSSWQYLALGLLRESPILTWKWGLTDQHLGGQRKAAEEGRCCQPPQLSCSRAQPPLYLLTCSSPGCAYRCENKMSGSGKRTCDTTLPTNILWGVGMQKMNKWEVFLHCPTYKSVSWPRS